MNDKTERKRLAILRALQQANRPLGSSRIAERLMAMGHEVSERTVRFYLQALDAEGMTESVGRRGRRITPRGQEEVAAARVLEKVGYLAARIDQMTYRMSFDLSRRGGTVVVNATLIRREDLAEAAKLIIPVFAARYGMGELLTIFFPGDSIGETTVPDGMVGIGTVCSITLNGVLLAHGIPTYSKFGGLLELRNREATRFVEIIHYDGTSLDPLEIFIRSGMTDYTGAVENGNGRIGASFREMPADSRDQVIDLAHRLEKVGLGGLYRIGWPGRPLLEIPVPEGRVGAIVIGGLNPAGILEEHGIKTCSRALAGLVEYERLFHYRELNDRLRDWN